MSVPMFGYLIAGADESSSRLGASPRLRELILGLLSADIAAADILARLDPDVADEVRAVVAHRGMSAEMFLANALIAFALDAADETWRQAVKYREPFSADAEADAVAELLSKTMRQKLDREIALDTGAHPSESQPPLGRRVG